MEFSNACQRAILEAMDAVEAARLSLPTPALAERLGISEGEVQASRLGRDVWTLPLTPCQLARHLGELGSARAVTEATSARLVQSGLYPGMVRDATVRDSCRRVLGWQPQRWHWACLVRGEAPLAPWHLQLYDLHGRCVHRCSPLNGRLSSGWQALVAMRSDTPPAFTRLAPLPPRTLPEAPGLAAAWARVADESACQALLNRYRLERHEALALLEGRFTQALPLAALPLWLAATADWGVELTIRVANSGCRQTACGRILRLRRRGRWLVVTGESYSLRLDMQGIEHLWQVPRQRSGGQRYTRLEAFDGEGRPVAAMTAAHRGRRSNAHARWSERRTLRVTVPGVA